MNKKILSITEWGFVYILGLFTATSVFLAFLPAEVSYQVKNKNNNSLIEVHVDGDLISSKTFWTKKNCRFKDIISNLKKEEDIDLSRYKMNEVYNQNCSIFLPSKVIK